MVAIGESLVLNLQEVQVKPRLLGLNAFINKVLIKLTE